MESISGNRSSGDDKMMETVVVAGRYVDIESDGGQDQKMATVKSKFTSFLWQGCTGVLTLPYSFFQLGMLSGIVFQVFYGLLGGWTAYLISILYLEYRSRKEREKVDFRYHVIQVHLSIYSSSSVESKNFTDGRYSQKKIPKSKKLHILILMIINP